MYTQDEERIIRLLRKTTQKYIFLETEKTFEPDPHLHQTNRLHTCSNTVKSALLAVAKATSSSESSYRT